MGLKIQYEAYDPKLKPTFKIPANTVMLSICNKGATNLLLNGYDLLGPSEETSTPVVPGEYMSQDQQWKVEIAKDELKDQLAKVLIRFYVKE